MFRRQKLRAHRRAATSQSGIGSREINETRLGISQNKTGAIIVKALWKIEAPLLQLIERWARTELAQYKNGRHIQRTTERFAQAHRPKTMMTVILWIVIGVFIANCIGRVRQQARSGEQPFIDRVEVNERFQRRSTTARLHCAVNLRHSVILGANHGADCACRIFDDHGGGLRDVVPV